MFTDMDRWIEIRRRVLNGERNKQAACAESGIHWDTLTKILTHSKPPGYRLTNSRAWHLDPFLPVIHEILENDRTLHRKQRHTVRRIFDRCLIPAKSAREQNWLDIWGSAGLASPRS